MRKSLAALVCVSTLAAGCAMSDADITAAVKSKLAADKTVDAFDVDVDTSYHVVTLTGRVHSVAEHDHAVQIVRDTRGVRDVVDRLRVSETAATSGAGVEARPAGTSGVRELAGKPVEEMTDAAITSKVRANLLADDSLASMKIAVKTDNGIVMLNGNVPTRGDAFHAVRLTEQVNGVRKVVDNLHTIHP